MSKAKAVVLMGILAGLMGALACDLEDTHKAPEANNKEGAGVKRKTVVVHTFKKLSGETYNFNTDIPTMLAATDGVLYTATTGTKNLHAYRVVKGNHADAWEKLDDFQGSHATADFDLNNGTRTIENIAAAKGGVAVAVSDDSVAAVGTIAAIGAQLGIALFLGQNKKAAMSSGLTNQKQGVTTTELKEVSSVKAESVIYALSNVTLAPNTFSVVSWLNRGNAGVAQEFSLQFPGPPATQVYAVPNVPLQALASLPDRRVAIAKAGGLLTIAKDSVGKAAADNPVLEQKLTTDVLDGKHANQFDSAIGKAPVQIGAMELVGDKHLLIGFVDDGSKTGGFVVGTIAGADITFAKTIAASGAKVKKISALGDEARIVTEGAVYQFKDGKVSLMLNGATLATDRAHISSGVIGSANYPNVAPVTSETFKGGNWGEVPEDGTKFYATAPVGDAWFYATDKGVYEVTTTSETRSFE